MMWWMSIGNFCACLIDEACRTYETYPGVDHTRRSRAALVLRWRRCGGDDKVGRRSIGRRLISTCIWYTIA